MSNDPCASSPKFAFTGEGVTLSATNPDSGSAEDHVAIGKAEGDDVSIGFNGRYVLDMLAACPADRLTFVLGDPGSPARVEPEGDDATLFVIMPMRV